MSYERYKYDIKDLIDKFPDYLQTPGSTTMIQVKMFHEILELFQAQTFTMWDKLSISNMEEEYLTWSLSNPDLDDSKWKYTDMLERLCKTYDIIREHPVGRLRNSHMIRLLKVKIMGVGFDGSREKLDDILNSLFDERSNIQYLTMTVNSSHAEADIVLIKSKNTSAFDEIDDALFTGGYYFLDLLGVKFNYSVEDIDSLVYDYTDYDDKLVVGDGKKYDKEKEEA